MIEVPQKFKPKINTVYPYENEIEYERWFGEVYSGCKAEREYLGIYWCGYQVNHSYGNDIEAMAELQSFVDSLPRHLKYFTISQYDDGCGVDFNGLDIIVFDMSKPSKYNIPLICMPHSHESDNDKTYFASFVGKHTHPIREHIFNLKGNEGYVIGDADIKIDNYCKIMSNSIFNLSPRGYGLSSFRMYEGLQYGCIPIYVSDQFILPFYFDFKEIGILVDSYNFNNIDNILKKVSDYEIIQKQDRIKELYDTHFTYNGLYSQIIKAIEAESTNNP